MRARHVVITLLALSIVGVAAAGFLGSRGRLPPRLAQAYGTVAALASSASEALSAPRTVSDAADGGDAAPPTARRSTQAGPLSSAQLGAPLVDGKFVSECGAPDDMKVVVKVAVKMGRPVAVAVTTDPPSSAVAACVEKVTRGMRWDSSPKMQHATVTY
jgi:hypothetical protein